jgi:small subunit ribosomal protein S8
MTDPIADMLTRIRNAQSTGKKSVAMPSSTIKEGILNTLESEGFIDSFHVVKDGPKATVTVELRYYEGKPVIAEIKRVSRPGLRVYKNSSDIPKVRNGLGVAILSTSKGIITDKQARALGEGGEVICTVV